MPDGEIDFLPGGWVSLAIVIPSTLLCCCSVGPFLCFSSLWLLQAATSPETGPRPGSPKRDHVKQNKSDQCNAVSSISFPTTRVLDLFCLPPLYPLFPFLHVGCSDAAHPVSWRRSPFLLDFPGAGRGV